MAEYILTQSGVTRVSDHAFIPDDGRNLDWQVYTGWVKSGGIPAPMPAVVVDPAIAKAEIVRQSAETKLVLLGLTVAEAGIVTGVANVTPDPILITPILVTKL